MIKMRGKANNNIFFPCLWLNLHKFNFIISQRNFYGGLFGSVQPEVNVSVSGHAGNRRIESPFA